MVSYWYCPNCKIELDGCHVTYEEKCEYCGSDVLSVPETISQEELDELIKAKADGRLVVLPCKVWELLQKYKELTEPQGDEAETYTTGYRNGHRNGQAELIAYLLQIDTGTREAAEKALERSGQDGCGEKNKA